MFECNLNAHKHSNKHDNYNQHLYALNSQNNQTIIIYEYDLNVPIRRHIVYVTFAVMVAAPDTLHMIVNVFTLNGSGDTVTLIFHED